MSDQPPFGLPEIEAILPHRFPFLFVDRVNKLEPGKSIEAERFLHADEPQFAGHFPGEPMMPGVLVAEALAQASGLLIGLSKKLMGEPLPERAIAFVLAATNIKFVRPARPGELLLLRATSERNLGRLFLFQAEARVGSEIIASGSLTLSSTGHVA